jgi:ADP-heptose:LPS heptosyltransferase
VLQTDTLARLGPNSRVALIRLRSLGDSVLCTPAIRLLKQHRPDLEIAIVVEPRFACVFEGNPDISQILPPTARALRAFAPDLCLNLHGGTRSARLTLLSGARHRAGFDIFKPGWIYNTPIPTAQEILGITRRVHTAEHQASAIFYLGVPIQEVPGAQIFATASETSSYAVIHPVAATPEKTWPAANFLELARQLPFEPVFIAGPDEDLTAFRHYRTLAGAPFPELANLLRNAKLFIGNDSGPAHVAAAFGVPQLVFFGPSDEEIWHPWRTRHHLLKSHSINKITVAQAVTAIQDLNP